MQDKKIFFINLLILILCLLALFNIFFGKYRISKYFQVKNELIRTSKIEDLQNEKIEILKIHIDLIKDEENIDLDFLEELVNKKLKLVDKESYILTNF